MSVMNIEIEDYPDYDLARRYGELIPPHPEIEELLARDLDRFETEVRSVAGYQEQFRSFRLNPSDEFPTTPTWDNGFLPPLDSMALFAAVSNLKPRTYLEIGSGNSTKVAAEARRVNSPDTRIVSVDPSPTTEVDNLCDGVVRNFLEHCDISELCEMLSPGDILFQDGSHRTVQNSDTTVFFLEILPRLPAGVRVHIHDIFWPEDYPSAWRKRLYSEQYMLGLLLLFGWDRFRTVLPNFFVSKHPELLSLLDQTWTLPGLAGLPRHGGSFWFETL